MKLPRFSLRTMLIAVAIIAAVAGWLRYESQRGWTVAKIEKLLTKEFDPTWDYDQLMLWAAKHGFHGGSGVVDPWHHDGPKLLLADHAFTVSVFPEDDANPGPFRRGYITITFHYDADGYYLYRSIHSY